MNTRRKPPGRARPEPAGSDPPAPAAPDTPAAPKPFNAFLREHTALSVLTSLGAEQSWSPPALLVDGKLIANLPGGVHRPLKSHEIIELMRVHREWNRVLTMRETIQLLGWPEP